MSDTAATAEVDWKYMAWTQSLAAGRAWDAGYAAAKEQYGGFSIDLDKMAQALADADKLTYGSRSVLSDAVEYRDLARAALDYIEKQADA
ncbi:hypothetical protein [Curtobacterium sp. MCBD17_030]|uniref:hypothetical protein n=1 Tax=Curtobacterium sp. MCBD17_030 TaxID=2175649 RepID=UPI000D87EBA2|nr:hypothetical protein [Curtobacterium sp. MCBD17_030]PYY32380.1 hypothetical protein DEI89_13185 [Curtobacterium sp. MCBD17_030]